MKQLEKSLDRYISLSSEIWQLASPQIETIKNANEYRKVLIENFTKVGVLSQEIKSLLDEDLYSILQSERLLSSEQVDALLDFSKKLTDPYTLSCTDMMLGFMIANKLCEDAKYKQDDRLLIRALDRMIASAYCLMILAFRLAPSNDIVCYEYRDQGLLAFEHMRLYLEKKRFESLPDEESRHIILNNTCLVNALKFCNGKQDKTDNQEDIEFLRYALEISDDPFYLKETPGYDWRRYKFSILQYFAEFTQRYNSRGLSEDLIEEIYGCTQKLTDIWASDEGYYSTICPRSTMDLYLARVKCLSGRMSVKEYKGELKRLLDEADPNGFSADDIKANLLVLDEYIMVVKQTGMQPEDQSILRYHYKKLPAYVFRIPKTKGITYAISMIAQIIKDYESVPDVDFAEFCIELVAAVHPQTYVHSLTVSSITKALTGHLINVRPDLFAGLCDSDSEEEVLKHKDELMDHAEKAALYHDIGKLFVMEIVTMYGRRLQEEEFDLIYTHPDIGAYALGKHDETKEYTSVAYAHHFYFNELSGMDSVMLDVNEQPFIDAACVADGMDAATDDVGRSYRRGKNFDEFLTELRSYRGTRYASYVVDLFDDPEVQNDIKTILTEGRIENYRKAFDLLTRFSAE